MPRGQITQASFFGSSACGQRRGPEYRVLRSVWDRHPYALRFFGANGSLLAINTLATYLTSLNHFCFVTFHSIAPAGACPRAFLYASPPFSLGLPQCAQLVIKIGAAPIFPDLHRNKHSCRRNIRC